MSNPGLNRPAGLPPAAVRGRRHRRRADGPAARRPGSHRWRRGQRTRTMRTDSGSYTPFQSEPDAAPVRIILRRVKPTPGSELALFATYSYHAFIIDRDGNTLDLEADHSRHAETWNAIRDLKYVVGLNHIPSCRLAGCEGNGSQPRPVDGTHRSGQADGDHQDPAAAILCLGRTAHPLGPPPHIALASEVALGGPVHWRPDRLPTPPVPS